MFTRFIKENILFFVFIILIGLPCYSHSAGPSSYRIGPGDKLKVDIWQEDDLTGTYTVSKEGILIINWLEPIKIDGLTLEEAKQKLTLVIKKYIKQPVVTLSVTEYRSKKVTVLGEVKLPGQFYLKSENTLLDILLKEAGGVTTNAGETISVLRGKGDGESNGPEQTIQVNLKKLLQGDRTQNLTLQQGDSIIVPRFDSSGVGHFSSDSVFVLGEVARSGSYKITDGYTVLNAILDAGGFSKFASQNRVKLVRNEGSEKKEFVIPMKEIMSSGDKSKDMAILPGDIIIIPKSIF